MIQTIQIGENSMDRWAQCVWIVRMDYKVDPTMSSSLWYDEGCMYTNMFLYIGWSKVGCNMEAFVVEQTWAPPRSNKTINCHFLWNHSCESCPFNVGDFGSWTIICAAHFLPRFWGPEELNRGPLFVYSKNQVTMLSSIFFDLDAV